MALSAAGLVIGCLFALTARRKLLCLQYTRSRRKNGLIAEYAEVAEGSGGYGYEPALLRFFQESIAFLLDLGQNIDIMGNALPFGGSTV